uniref:Uncharacterized protein n=1 Tax=Timema bartmani TaxID=61472 RepID=A0A7R9F5D0_9NEOP|nr:unnamed protein product [Timema bartmani]
MKVDSSCLLDALARGLLASDRRVLAARILALNSSSGQVMSSTYWRRQVAPEDHRSLLLELGGPRKVIDEGPHVGTRPDPRLPWYEDAESSPGLRSPKFMDSPSNVSYRGWWTFPYYSCTVKRWLLSYSVAVPSPGSAEPYWHLTAVPSQGRNTEPCWHLTAVPSQGRNNGIGRKWEKLSNTSLNVTLEVVRPQPSFLVMSLVEDVLQFGYKKCDTVISQPVQIADRGFTTHRVNLLSYALTARSALCLVSGLFELEERK